MSRPQDGAIAGGRARRSSAWARAERLSLTLGLAGLLVWGAARAHGALAGSRALAEARARFGASASSGGASEAASRRIERLAARLPAPDTSDWDSRRVALWRQDSARDGAAPVAILEYPAVELSVAVLEGVDELALNRGVGLVPGSALPGEGNCSLAGHRDGYFRRLERAELGDRLRLTSAHGVGEYQIVSLDVVRPDDVSVLVDEGRPELTLITCHPFRFLGSAPNRFVLHARRVGFQPAAREDGSARRRTAAP